MTISYMDGFDHVPDYGDKMPQTPAHGLSVTLVFGDGAPNAPWHYYEKRYDPYQVIVTRRRSRKAGRQAIRLRGVRTVGQRCLVGYAWRGNFPKLIVDAKGGVGFEQLPGHNWSVNDIYVVAGSGNE